MEEVCLRVTMFESGVVMTFEQAAARAPTPSSSRAGRLVALLPFL